MTVADVQALVTKFQNGKAEERDKDRNVISPAERGFSSETIIRRINILRYAFQMAPNLKPPLPFTMNPVDGGEEQQLFELTKKKSFEHCAIVLVALDTAMRRVELLRRTSSKNGRAR